MGRRSSARGYEQVITHILWITRIAAQPLQQARDNRCGVEVCSKCALEIHDITTIATITAIQNISYRPPT
jgi:hypothetical protein